MTVQCVIRGEGTEQNKTLLVDSVNEYNKVKLTLCIEGKGEESIIVEADYLIKASNNCLNH